MPEIWAFLSDINDQAVWSSYVSATYFDGSSIDFWLLVSRGLRSSVGRAPVAGTMHLSSVCNGHIFISHWSLQFLLVLGVLGLLSLSPLSFSIWYVNCHWGSTLKEHTGWFMAESYCCNLHISVVELVSMQMPLVLSDREYPRLYLGN